MILVLILVDPTRIFAQVLIRDGDKSIPFHGEPLAMIVRPFVGMISVDHDCIKLRLPDHELNVIPVQVAPLKYTLAPIKVAVPPATNDVTTVIVRVTLREIFPAVSILE